MWLGAGAVRWVTCVYAVFFVDIIFVKTTFTNGKTYDRLYLEP